jgi:hypothetical protein
MEVSNMNESELKKGQNREERKKFSEVNEYNHDQNQVAKSQKQISSQETAGVIDEE